MARKKKNSEGNVESKSISKEIPKIVYKPEKYSKEELELIAKLRERLKREPLKSSALSTLNKTKQANVDADMILTLAKMTKATGSPNHCVQMLFLDQVISTFKGIMSSEGFKDDETVLKTCDIALALLDGINPQDEIEGMLAVQMVGVHNMALDAMRLTMISDQYPEAKERNTNRAIKLLRTFTAQMEALDKHRRKGQQKVVVEHVHVHKGGQAIVGNVNPGGGAENEK
jgi:hypothetical protein